MLNVGMKVFNIKRNSIILHNLLFLGANEAYGFL